MTDEFSDGIAADQAEIAAKMERGSPRSDCGSSMSGTGLPCHLRLSQIDALSACAIAEVLAAVAARTAALQGKWICVPRKSVTPFVFAAPDIPAAVAARTAALQGKWICVPRKSVTPFVFTAPDIPAAVAARTAALQGKWILTFPSFAVAGQEV